MIFPTSRDVYRARLITVSITFYSVQYADSPESCFIKVSSRLQHLQVETPYLSVRMSVALHFSPARLTAVRQSALIKSTQRPLWELITPFRRVGHWTLRTHRPCSCKSTTGDSAIKADAAASGLKSGRRGRRRVRSLRSAHERSARGGVAIAQPLH